MALKVIEASEAGQAVVDAGGGDESRVDVDVVGPGEFTLRFEADPKLPIGVRLTSESGALVERSLGVQEIPTR